MNKKSVLGLVLLLGMAFSLAANEKYAEGKCYDTTDRLRIRSGSDLKSEVITVLDKGSCVVFLEKGPSATIDNITDSWVKVKALPRENWEDGKRCGTREGWLFGGYLKESPIVRDELFKGKDFSIVQYYDGKREIIDHRDHRFTRVFLVSDNQSEEYLTENEEPYSLYEGSIPKEKLLLNTEWLTPNDKVVYKDIDKDGQDEIIFCFDPSYRITYILKKEKKICKIIFALSLPMTDVYWDNPNLFYNISFDFDSNPSTIKFDTHSPGSAYRGYDYVRTCYTWSRKEKKYVSSYEYYLVQNNDRNQIKKLTDAEVKAALSQDWK